MSNIFDTGLSATYSESVANLIRLGASMLDLKWAGMLQREKQLWFSVIVNTLLLAVFLAIRLAWHSPRNPAVVFLTISYILPLLFGIGEIYGKERTISDERDLLIQKRGRNAGFLLLSAGIYVILLYLGAEAFPYASALLVLWLSSRIVTDSVQLRCYAGHEAWWPDRLIARLNRRREDRIEALRARIHP